MLLVKRGQVNVLQVAYITNLAFYLNSNRWAALLGELTFEANSRDSLVDVGACSYCFEKATL